MTKSADLGPARWAVDRVVRCDRIGGVTSFEERSTTLLAAMLHEDPRAIIKDLRTRLADARRFL